MSRPEKESPGAGGSAAGAYVFAAADPSIERIVQYMKEGGLATPAQLETLAWHLIRGALVMSGEDEIASIVALSSDALRSHIGEIFDAVFVSLIQASELRDRAVAAWLATVDALAATASAGTAAARHVWAALPFLPLGSGGQAEAGRHYAATVGAFRDDPALAATAARLWLRAFQAELWRLAAASGPGGRA
jgi:hypothetical protein